MKHRATVTEDGTIATGYYCQADNRHWLVLPAANVTGGIVKTIDGIVEIDPDTLEPVLTFGELVAEKRRAKGWSQTELAELVGITSRNYLSQIERDIAKNPSLVIFLELCAALEIAESDAVTAWRDGAE